MKPKRFIEAVKELNFPEVLDDADFGRVQALYVEAVDQSADRVLVGFRVRGPVVRIVWAVVEVIPNQRPKRGTRWLWNRWWSRFRICCRDPSSGV